MASQGNQTMALLVKIMEVSYGAQAACVLRQS